MDNIYNSSNLLEQEKNIKEKLTNSQDKYNSSKQLLASLNSQLNDLKLQQNRYNDLKSELPNKRRKILLISSFCLLFCFTRLLPIVIISSIILLTNFGINILQIIKIRKQLKNLNIKNITSNIENLELSIDKKRKDVKEAYKEIDKNHKLLIEINNEKISQKINLENIEYDLKKQYVRR